MNNASFSKAPVPTDTSIDVSPWILNERFLLYARAAPAVITLLAEPTKL